ncbi:MFS general substrate transporter [Phialemonium atrogriseum]|uniref:MFS general substrate transporter n=1 Tax=Phialemonium atrogriseum TaxID=1093897 RepID=A0AAJ0FMN0_9PEZI|nr:MFS general substrate transporter [Phialemonium atrogriseum]KAK1768433.1 MFS general substrate transporter [Phialemonium atrogriseum]
MPAKNADENTPLLSGEDVTRNAEPGTFEATTLNEPGANGNDKPLPRLQIALLCYARVVEPVAFFCIFPFINQMVQENGNLDDADVGFYSGVIESLFSLTQMAVMILWGEAADRLGRKPVLVLSLAGVTVATSIFGMAKTIWQMILFRCLAGVFAGTIVTIRTMISEHSTSKTQARSFSWFAFAGNLGIFFGPLVGGALADPARQYPKLFKNIQFFTDYPYALPNFAVGIICLTATIVTALFVTETLVKKPSGISGDDSALAASKPPPPSNRELLKSPGVAMAVYSYGHVMLLAFAYTAIVPLFWFTPVPLGGFGLTSLQISLLMGVNGFAQAIWILFVFPPLQHRIGTAGVLRVCAIAYPIFFATSPLFNALLRLDSQAAVTAFWVIMPVSLAVGCGVSMSFTAVQLALNDVSPSPQVLGMLNALALTGVSGTRAFSPALFTSLFAIGARTQWLWGYSIWVVMTLVAGAWTVASRNLPDYDEMKRRREREGEE